MGVERRILGDVTVLELHGEFFGGDTSDELSEAVSDEAARGNTRLVLDLSACTYMSSYGVAAVIGARHLYASRNGEVKLCGLHGRVERAFVTTRVNTVFAVYPTVNEAVSSFEGVRQDPEAG